MQLELDNRIAAAWGSFHEHKSELCSKHYSLKDRVKLFEAVVTPTALYGASTWTLKLDMVKQLKTAWRKMLRYVFRCFCKKKLTYRHGYSSFESLCEKLNRWQENLA